MRIAHSVPPVGCVPLLSVDTRRRNQRNERFDTALRDNRASLVRHARITKKFPVMVGAMLRGKTGYAEECRHSPSSGKKRL